MAWRFDPRDFTSAAIARFFAANGGWGRWARVAWYDWATAFLFWRHAQGWQNQSEWVPDEMIPGGVEMPATPDREE